MTSSLFSLRDKNALVTGATGLLGREHCLALAEAGARVIIADLDSEHCTAWAQELESRYPLGHRPLVMDVGSDESVHRAVGSLIMDIERIDVLVNNAAMNDKVEGKTTDGDTALVTPVDYPAKVFHDILNINVTGVLRCIQAIGRYMIAQKSGSIINIASTYGIVAPNQDLYVRPDGSRLMYKSPAYSASKAAVIALTQYYASAWGEYGVRVNTLSPGGVENAQEEWFIEGYKQKTALKAMARPDDYRGAIVFLAGLGSRYMTGANVVVDGGWTAM